MLLGRCLMLLDDCLMLLNRCLLLLDGCLTLLGRCLTLLGGCLLRLGRCLLLLGGCLLLLVGFGGNFRGGTAVWQQDWSNLKDWTNLLLRQFQPRPPGQPGPGGVEGLLYEGEVGGDGFFVIPAQFVVVVEQVGYFDGKFRVGTAVSAIVKKDYSWGGTVFCEGRRDTAVWK